MKLMVWFSFGYTGCKPFDASLPLGGRDFASLRRWLFNELYGRT